MGIKQKPSKIKDFGELRVYIDNNLLETFHKNAELEKRTYGKQLEYILEQYYKNPIVHA